MDSVTIAQLNGLRDIRSRLHP